MKHLFLLGALLAVRAFAIGPPDPSCARVSSAASEAGAKAFAEAYGLSSRDAEAILADPKYASKASNAVAFFEWIQMHADTPPGKTFFEAMARRLASPAYSSEDIALESRLRWNAIVESLTEARLSAPSPVLSLMWGIAESYPSLPAPIPLTGAEVARRRQEFFANLPNDVWLVLYRDFFRFNGGKQYLNGGKLQIPLPPAKSVKILLRDRKLLAQQNQLKAKLEAFLLGDLRPFMESLKPDEQSPARIRQRIAEELGAYCRKHDISDNERNVMEAYLQFLFHEEAPVVYDARHFPREWTQSIGSAVSDLRRLWLIDEKERRTESIVSTPPAVTRPSPPPVLDSTPVNRAPRVPQPRKELAPAARPVEEVAAAAPIPPASKPPVFKPLTAAEEDALFLRLSPTDSHHAKFLKSMERCYRRLREAEYTKLHGKIVETLWLLEKEVEPAMIPGLSRTRQHGVLELKPLGNAFTIRLFIGKSGRHVRILTLADDVKSGGETEHRLLIELRDEWKAIAKALGDK